MTTIADPVIGRWYKDVENKLTFTVVAIEEDNDLIEVQYLDGDIGEYDTETWYNSTFDYVEAPEDWSAPYDDLEPDDLGYSDPDIHGPDQDNIDFSDYYED